MKARRVALLAGLSVCLSFSGCSVLDPGLIAVDAGGTDTDPGDTAVDTGVDAPPTEDGCRGMSRTPPSRPDVPDGDGPEVIFGLKEVDLLQRGEAWRDIGFNLDGLCTAGGDEPLTRCIPPSDTAVPVVDGNEGIDNSFGSLLSPLLSSIFPDLATAARESAEEGVGVIVFRIRNWNGEANDPSVEVTMSQSVAGTPGVAGVEMPPPVEFGPDFKPYVPSTGLTELLPMPTWDGNDWVWLRDESFAFSDLEQPRIRDDNAYIANNQIVINLPDRAEIVFANTENGLIARLTDAVAVGTISDDRTRMTPAVFGGRWGIIDLLDTARTVNVCDGDPEFNILRNLLDTIADVRSDGPGATCDAMSIGISFEGYRVRIAGLTPGQIPPDTCE